MTNRRLEYPALNGETVTEFHVGVCREFGHATHTMDGTAVRMCPRCGDPVKHTVGPVGTSARGAVRHYAPTRLGQGASRSWERTIAGQTYNFTIVDMPDGEVRWSIQRYNGYPEPMFACAWSLLRNFTFRPTEG